MADSALWYRVNRFAGCSFLVAAAASICVFTITPALASGRSFLGLLVFLVPLFGALAAVAVYLRKITSSRGPDASFGVLGGLVYAATEKRSKTKREERIRNLDLVQPSGHVGSGKHNFHATTLDVESSELLPRARFAGHGEHFGRWILKLRGQKAITLELQTAEDMQRAYDLLPGAMSVHANKVEWNSAKGSFVALRDS